ncbi:trypsin-like peptidase domain-containing protein [Actinomadura meyerae]|uniref:nSTAND1 domain-containing NTPase n=1 Tax=Actinomadura meyerae TaxID=240840 RepID=UPI000B77A672|nr:PQQ-binding-like beta-propeller repeat protein [Actinomadura meyerae]
MTSPERFLVKVIGSKGRAVGRAFVAGDREVVTCAHVINVALDRPEREASHPGTGWVTVEFPFAGRADERVVRLAKLAVWLPESGPSFDMLDFAGLRLDEALPSGVEPVTLSSAGEESPDERRVELWGPNLSSRGGARDGYVQGTLLHHVDRSRLQVIQDRTGAFRAQRGYSGGPVWQQSTGQVVGLVQAVPRDENAVDVYVIGGDVLVDAWPEVLYRPPPNPYKGLAAFTEADARYFFGRQHFVDEIVLAAETEPLITVVGRSGVGKSSVIAAGLVPELRKKHRLTVGEFRPGDHPVLRMAAAFMSAAGTRPPYSEAALSSWMRRIESEGIAAAAEYACAARDVPFMLLVIDQFEQIFTECTVPERREMMLRLLGQVVQQSPGSLRIALSIRNDFFWDLMETEDLLGSYVQTHAHKLLPMTATDLYQTVAEPARAAGGSNPITFDDGLIELICEEFRGQPAELPLLEFTLARLWETQRGRKLTLKTYRDLGGVTRTLAVYAEERYGMLSSDQQDAASRIFTELVHPHHVDVARQVRRLDLRAADWPTVERLRDERLLDVHTSDDTGTVTVEIAHEALLRGWDRLRGWLERNREFRTWKADIVNARELWELHGRNTDLLLRGPVLTRAIKMAADHPDDVTGVREFIAISAEHAATELRERHRLSRETEALRMASRSREIFSPDALNLSIAITLGISSLDRAHTQEGDLALRRALDLTGRPVCQLAHSGEVSALAFNSSGDRVATASRDGTVRIWHIETGAELLCLSHYAAVPDILYSPTDEWIASACEDGTARIWDAESGEEIGRLSNDGLPVTRIALDHTGELVITTGDSGVARAWKASDATELFQMRHDGLRLAIFNPAGTHIATAGDDGSVRIWRRDGGQLSRLSHDMPVLDVAFDSSGEQVSTACDDGIIRIWNPRTGDELRRFAHGGSVCKVVFSPDGNRVGSAGSDGTARVWDLSTGSEVYRLTHGDRALDVTFNAAGDLIASSSADGTARVASPALGRQLSWLVHERQVRTVVFSPSGDHIATASRDGTAKIWDIATGAEPLPLVHEGPVWHTVFNLRGDRVATVSDDGTAVVWNPATGKRLADHRHGAPVRRIAFGPDDDHLASAGTDGAVCLWDPDSSTPLRHLRHAGGVSRMAYDPSSSRFATASDDGTARVWDTTTGAELLRISHHRPVIDVAFSSDGTLIATGDRDGIVRLSDTDTGDQLLHLAHRGSIRRLAFSPNGELIATASDDGTARVWDANTGTELFHITHHHPVLDLVFSPDGALLATAARGGIARISDLSTGEELHQLVHDGSVWAVTFNPDGKLLATACHNAIAIIWDSATGTILSRLYHNAPVVGVAFNPTGDRIATSCRDGIARLWLVKHQDVVREAYRRLPRKPTLEEWRRYLPRLDYPHIFGERT